MNRSQNLERMLAGGLIAVVRSDAPFNVQQLTQTLLDAGVESIEITLTIPGALRIIETLAAHFADKILLGAGTILDPETARLAILAGAKFIVSPCLDLPTITLCHRYDVLAIPGALTATEVLTAWQAGADIVKIFPGDVMGADYFKAVRRPLPQIRMMPTGAITPEAIPKFIAAGACAIGAGASLISSHALQQEDWSSISKTAKEFLAAIQQARAQLLAQ
jgi:2-dehydro-3-deoxyphosphogluconate aldolase/(4S)-4-hydroxy-2-oxoglutarate aldolase